MGIFMPGCMTGWRHFEGSGPLMWMRWNAILTAWIHQHQPTGSQEAHFRAPTAKVTQESRNENQADHRVRGRPGQGAALLHGRSGLCQEDRFQSGALSL